MHVAELLVRTDALDSHTRFELLRQVQDARCFLLQVAAWGVCASATVWQLRKVYNRDKEHRDRRWLPLIFLVVIIQWRSLCSTG